MRRIVSVRLRRRAMPARDTLQSRGEWRMGLFLNGQQPRAPSLRDLLAGPEPIETIRMDGTPVAALSGLRRVGEFTDFIGLPEIQELEQRFSSLPVQTRS